MGGLPYQLKLFQEKTEKQDKHQIPNRTVPTTYPAPEGLRMVAYLRNEIKTAGAKNGIDPQCQRHSKIDPFYLTNGKVKLTPLISY